jgi:hypothetical protein
MVETGNNMDQNAGQGVSDFSMALSSLPITPTPQRKFTGFSPNLTPQEIQEIQNDANIRFSQITKPRVIGGVLEPSYYDTYVRGAVLFDEQGRVAGKQYDISDPFVVARQMYKMSTAERIRVAKELERIGWYGNSKVSEALMNGIGWADEDERVWGKLLSIANTAQKPWSDVVGMLGTFATVQTGGGVTVRVTSDEDAMAYAREAFFSRLGRAPTKKELADAIDFIQNKERSAVRAGQQMPSSQVSAAGFAEAADPTAKTSWGLGNAIAIAMNALGQ